MGEESPYQDRPSASPAEREREDARKMHELEKKEKACARRRLQTTALINNIEKRRIEYKQSIERDNALGIKGSFYRERELEQDERDRPAYEERKERYAVELEVIQAEVMALKQKIEERTKQKTKIDVAETDVNKKDVKVETHYEDKAAIKRDEGADSATQIQSREGVVKAADRRAKGEQAEDKKSAFCEDSWVEIAAAEALDGWVVVD